MKKKKTENKQGGNFAITKFNIFQQLPIVSHTYSYGISMSCCKKITIVAL